MKRIIPIGDTVTLGSKQDGIQGTVLAAMIGPRLEVTYKCSWWNGRKREEGWLSEIEVHQETNRSQTIGFHDFRSPE